MRVDILHEAARRPGGPAAGEGARPTAVIPLMALRCLVILGLFATSLSATTLRYWVDACTRPESGCRATDPELAQWALEAWQSASGGKLIFEKASEPGKAQIRIHWVTTRDGLYGEAVGGDVYVRAEAGEGLLRETIVYLTCLHESGHALGLSHTDAFADIMYSFQYGGDIPEYFGRYRRQLSARPDIRKHSGMSPDDRRRVVELYR
jgi:hypothetical protein